MPTFPLLADPQTYDPNEIDLSVPATFNHWLTVFSSQITSVLDHAIDTAGSTDDARQRAAAAHADFLDWLKPLHADPLAHGPLSLMVFDRIRDGIMASNGFADPHLAVKQKENALALPLIPDLLAELDALEGERRLMALVRGIFAGNIFDLGVMATIERFRDGGADFHGTRAGLPQRPWLVDHYDALATRWAGQPHRKAILFVDNAGADVTLGMIPFARELARRGTHVIISANTGPSLNDITHAELVDHMQHIAAVDPLIASAMDAGQIRLIASGCVLPLLDLRQVSAELAAASADADLVVLEGMGRSLETNHNAAFTCDVLKIAMIKDPQVAAWLGGKPYDLVCRFDPIL
jgi:type II pantothenate kinase